jgi:hypothetical protein
MSVSSALLQDMMIVALTSTTVLDILTVMNSNTPKPMVQQNVTNTIDAFGIVFPYSKTKGPGIGVVMAKFFDGKLSTL